MKTESYSFIDLAKLGRTNWWVPVLTVALIAFLSIISNLPVLLFTGGSLYFRNYHIANAVKDIENAATNPVVSIFAFWLACRKIMRRPFRTLISIDRTFSFRRCLLGAALYLPANVIGLAAMPLYASMRYGAWVVPFHHFEWPHGSGIIAAVFAIISIPFLAFGEELYFRGWLTQTLGQYIRVPLVVVAIVAVAFAAYHTQYDFRGKMLMVISSLGFSALSLRDQRLEFSIGAHSMLNICVVLQTLFLTGPMPRFQTSATVTTFDWFVFTLLKGALPIVLMYLILNITRGWFEPNRAAEVADVQPA